MNFLRRATPVRLWLYGLAILTFLVLISLGMGQYPMPIREVLGHWFGTIPLDETKQFVLNQIRLPRILMAILTGAALAVSGACMQGVFRNPLVSPFVLGLSNGATVGAAIGILFFDGNAWAVEGLAFLGAVCAVSLATLLSGWGQQTVTLLLFGMVISSLCGSAIGLMQYLADPDHRLPALVFWMLGGFDGVTAESLGFTLPAVTVSLLILQGLASTLNVLATGETDATILGIRVRPAKLAILGLSTLMVSTCVAKAGVIGWIGLVIPHLARLITGPDHRRLLPLAGIAGAAFLLMADNVARTAVSGELPVGIITAAIGSPIFGFLLWRNRGAAWSQQ